MKEYLSPWRARRGEERRGAEGCLKEPGGPGQVYEEKARGRAVNFATQAWVGVVQFHIGSSLSHCQPMHWQQRQSSICLHITLRFDGSHTATFLD